MALSIRPLGDALGAEVTGFDLKRDLNATTIEDINRAWANHIVLCFRDQDLSPEEALSPGTSQPQVRHHPPTGEKATYLNPIRTETIEGMPEAQAQKLLHTVLAHSTQPY